MGHENKMIPVNSYRGRLRTNFGTCTTLVPKTCSQPVFRAANRDWYLHQNRVRSIVVIITKLRMNGLAWLRLKARRAERARLSACHIGGRHAHRFLFD